MPTYVYECQHHGEFEVEHSMKEKLEFCPKCEEEGQSNQPIKKAGSSCLFYVPQSYLRFKKKINTSPSVKLPTSSLPVCLAKAGKSRAAPESVALIFNTSPDCIVAKAFLVRKIGSGQFIPTASTSASKAILATSVIYLPPNP